MVVGDGEIQPRIKIFFQDLPFRKNIWMLMIVRLVLPKKWSKTLSLTKSWIDKLTGIDCPWATIVVVPHYPNITAFGLKKRLSQLFATFRYTKIFSPGTSVEQTWDSLSHSGCSKQNINAIKASGSQEENF